MAGVAWRLKSDRGSRPPSLGALRKLPSNNTAAVGFSVYEELSFGGKLGHDKKMKRKVKRQNLSRFSDVMTLTFK